MTPQDRPRLPRRRLVAVLLVLVLAAAVSQLTISVFGLFRSTTSTGNNSFSASPCLEKVALTAGSPNVFTPASVTIAKDCFVQWTQTSSSDHTSTSTGTPVLWDSGTIGQNLTYTRKFTSAGTFPYKCKIHPTMTGTIIVNP